MHAPHYVYSTRTFGVIIYTPRNIMEYFILYGMRVRDAAMMMSAFHAIAL
jgi:hypothetical protein